MCNLFHSNDQTENKLCLPAAKRPKPTLHSLGTNSRAASSWVKKEGLRNKWSPHTYVRKHTRERGDEKKKRGKVKKKGWTCGKHRQHSSYVQKKCAFMCKTNGQTEETTTQLGKCYSQLRHVPPHKSGQGKRWIFHYKQCPALQAADQRFHLRRRSFLMVWPVP